MNRPGTCLHLQGGVQHLRRADKGVAMDRAEAEEHGLLKPGNGAEDPLLFRIGQLGLKSHQIVRGPSRFSARS